MLVGEIEALHKIVSDLAFEAIEAYYLQGFCCVLEFSVVIT